MKTLKTEPGARRLMESLRNMGYECSTAIADLVDNSIAAGSSEIYIDIIAKQEVRQDTIPQKKFHPAAVVIADNGNGMNLEKLHEAMKFGTIQDYKTSDLGKYGLGLKTASLSQCRILTVSSKEKQTNGNKPRKHLMRWDIDHVYETNDWNLLVPDEDDLEPWERKQMSNPVSEKNGTVILWSNLDGPLSSLSSNNSNERERLLSQVIEDVSAHLRMVFHRYMQGAVTGSRKLNITLCGVLLTPWDPFCRNEKTLEPQILSMKVLAIGPDESKIADLVTVSPYVLPRRDEFSSDAAWRDASGPKNWNLQQGFYFYRNNRLLQAGGWSRLKTSDEHTKLLRVAIDFSGELDQAFAINITKMRANIPTELKAEINLHLVEWIKAAKSRYAGSGSIANNPNPPQTNTSSDPISINVSRADQSNLGNTPDNDIESEVVTVFTKEGISWDHNSFSESIFLLLEAISKRKVTPEQIPLEDIKRIYEKL